MRGDCRVLAAVLLAGATLLSSPAWAGHGGVHVPQARVGDEALYVPADGGDEAERFAFTWQPREATKDRWSQPVDAHVLRVVAPAQAWDEDAPPRTWVEVREAYGERGDNPLWQERVAERTVNDDTVNFFFPVVTVGVPAQRDIVHHENVSIATYAPDPSFRSCLALHGYQGKTLATGAAVALTSLCPGLARRHLEAEASPARGTTFLGRNAVELAYEVRAEKAPTGDLALPARGTLRLVLADGLAFIAFAEATDASGARIWSYALDGHAAGTGAAIPTPRGGLPSEPLRRPDVPYAPLGKDGPVDGGSALVFTLDKAVANVRRSPHLVFFRNWEANHPDAFLARAELFFEREMQGNWEAVWWLAYADPRNDEEATIFRVFSQIRSSPGLPGFGDIAPEASVELEDVQTTTVRGAFERPANRPGLAIASLLRVAAEHAPGLPGEADVERLLYESPVDGRPAVLTVERRAQRGDAEVTWSTVSLDAFTGAVRSELRLHRQSAYGEELRPSLGEPITVQSAEPAMPNVASLGVASLTLTALVAALLAHAGLLTALYSRLRGSQLLDHPKRRRIYELVRAQPGIHFQGLLAVVGFRVGTLMYHLKVLERGSLITAKVLPGFTRYYVTGSVHHRAMLGQAELEGGRARTVYELVRGEPGLSLSELARRLGREPRGGAQGRGAAGEGGLGDKVDGGTGSSGRRAGPGGGELTPSVVGKRRALRRADVTFNRPCPSAYYPARGSRE